MLDLNYIFDLKQKMTLSLQTQDIIRRLTNIIYKKK